MATVTGFTAERMLEIENNTVVDGDVVGDNLILKTLDGTEIDAGSVRGPKGDTGVYTIPASLTGTPTYLRLATINGVSASTGAHLSFLISGLGQIASDKRATILVHVGQRGSNQISVKTWGFGLEDAVTPITLYTKQVAEFQFELWALFSNYQFSSGIALLSIQNSELVLDSLRTVAPASIVAVSISRMGRIANTGETLTGTSDSIVVTPYSLKAAIDDQYASALLDPAYIGPGPARVSFLPAGSLSTEAYEWVGEYKPWGNRVVNMRRRGSTWVIEGANSETGLGGKVAIPLLNNWVTYNDRNASPPFRWTTPRAQRLVSGIVILSGLIGYGSVASGTVIGMLPVGHRPDTDMLFPINNSDTAKTITIRANGEIKLEGGNWVTGYASLDGLAFPAAGVATWTNVGAAGSGTSFANGWTAYNTPIWGQPRYWVDPYGFTWWAGVIGGGTTTGDNWPMINVPSAISSHLQSHSKVACTNGLGFISALPGPSPVSSIAWKGGSTANTWLSLAGLCIVTPSALTLNNWVYPGSIGAMSGGWSRYSASFPDFGLLNRADGLGMSMGLLKGGTAPPLKIANLRAAQLPMGGQTILYAISAQVFARLDLYTGNPASDDRGTIFLGSGVPGWFSVDNQMWMIGE